MLAARGARNLDREEERIDDESSAAALRKDAAGIHLWSLAAAAIIAALAFFIAGAL
jgi:hypothetical protein